MLKLKLMHVNMISLAKVMGVIYGMFGVIMGCFIVISKIMGIELQGEAAQLQGFGFLAVLILPIIYCLIGAVSGLVSAFFFNTATKLMGPLELNVSEKA